jgi:hypothetical protein
MTRTIPRKRMTKTMTSKWKKTRMRREEVDIHHQK